MMREVLIPGHPLGPTLYLMQNLCQRATCHTTSKQIFLKLHLQILHPTIFSFFSGAGFLDLGFELSGFRVALVNEYYKPFLEAYHYARQHLVCSP